MSAFERIFGATIFFRTDNMLKAKVFQRTRLSFFREAQIWYSRDPTQFPIDDQFQNVIVLSDEFYREISAHPIPTDLEAVKALSDSPAVLDLFMLLSYRCFIAKVDESIRPSVHTDWQHRSDQLSTPGRDGSERTCRSGSRRCSCFGRRARLGLTLTGGPCMYQNLLPYCPNVRRRVCFAGCDLPWFPIAKNRT